MQEIDRRKFLGIAIGGVLVAAAGAITYPLYKFLAPRKSKDARQKVAIADSDVPVGGAKFFEFEGRTAVLVRKSGGALTALSAVCTHLGCIVQWQQDKEQFLCPCHGGQFSAEGTVIAGPPPRPLATIPFTVRNGSITVG
jgi:cytochrome b6-f complex iron-sulfur subunit